MSFLDSNIKIELEKSLSWLATDAGEEQITDTTQSQDLISETSNAVPL